MKKLVSIDKSLLGVVLILVLLGIGSIFIAGYHLSLKNRGYPYYYGYKHVTNLLLSIPIVITIILIPLRVWKKYSVPLFILTFIISLMVFFPMIGKKVSGANRWIQILGISFQPSEILKLGMIGCLSYMLSQKSEYINHLTRGIIPLFIIVILSSVVVAVEPDLSTAVILFFTGFFLIYVNRIRFTYLVFSFAVIFLFFLYVLQSKSYFISRFYFFIADLDPYGRGYHILQALKSFRLGGIVGMKDDSLLIQAIYFPDVHTDFIFSMMARIGGFMMVFFVLISLVYMLYRCFIISIRQKDSFLKNLGLGITFLFAIEILIHLAVNVGLAPTTGSILPFISYGRTAIITHLMMLGIVLNMSAEMSLAPLTANTTFKTGQFTAVNPKLQT